MPLLMCPNDNAAMQKLVRDGVEIDMCPTCRGVWLDRGELEKVLEGGRQDRREFDEDRERFTREVDTFQRDPEAWRRGQPQDSREQRHRHDDDYEQRRKKKRGFDLFDIFD
jgi:Zn-finger nucleic acid-binding protein